MVLGQMWKGKSEWGLAGGIALIRGKEEGRKVDGADCGVDALRVGGRATGASADLRTSKSAQCTPRLNYGGLRM